MVSIYFVLDKTFKKGTFDKVKIAQKEGRSIEGYLNDKETAIYLATTYKSNYIKVNSGLKVLPKNWDSENGKFKKSNMDYAQLNLLLHDYKYRIEMEVRELLLKRKDLKPYDIKELMILIIKGKQLDKNNIDFFSAFDMFYKEKSLTYTTGTMEKYHSLKKTFIDFSQDIIPLSFDSIDENFETKFTNYSICIKKHKNNTIVKNFRSIKVFLAWSYTKGYIDNQYYKSYKTKEDPIEVVYLKANEVDRIENLELKPLSKLDIARDVFLFQIFTGQRYSDIEDFCYKDIEWSEQGQIDYWINFQRKGKKTKAVRIPLLDKAKKIIVKYRSENDLPNDLVFPALSNAYQNELIKEVCKMAKINSTMTIVHYSGIKKIEKVAPKYKFIGTHAARRTFVTLSLERGMPKETIMKISGHEDDRAIKAYIHISEKFYTKEFFKAWG